MTKHKTGTREQWLAAWLELAKAEKELARRSFELVRQSRDLPWVRVEKQYKFQTADGPKSLAELFDGRSQLVVYHFMFSPDYEAGCPACSAGADSFNGLLPHLKARDVSMICVSRAPIEKLLAYRKRMGWSFGWASSHESDFNFDFGVSAHDGKAHDSAAPVLEASELGLLKMLNELPAFRKNPPFVVAQLASACGTNLDRYVSEGHGFSMFAREGDTVYHSYSTYTGGTEWLRRHDEYNNR